jgi:signal transduction histidine kinase
VAAPSLLFWSLPALLFSALTAADRPETAGRPPIGFAQAFLAYGLPWYFWAAITPVVLRLTRRYPLDSKRRARAIALHVTAGMTAGIAMGTISLTTHVLFGTGQSSPRGAVADILFWTPFGVLFYGALASVGFALDSHRRLREREVLASRMEAQLVEAQLGALRMQLQPHFLFNTLNAISALALAEPIRARRMISRLSDLLRLTLEERQTPLVPLSHELEFVRCYLEIQQERFRDRLRTRFDVADDTLRAAVPGMILQPLVENALRHGLLDKTTPGNLLIRARREGAHLHVSVEDDGLGLPDDVIDGVGLGTTRERLRMQFDDAASLDMRAREGGGTRVALRMPFQATIVARAA